MRLINYPLFHKLFVHEEPMLIYGLTEYGTKVEIRAVVNAYSVDDEKGYIKLWIGGNSPLILTEAFFFEKNQRFHGPEEEPAAVYVDPTDIEAPGVVNPERVALMKSWGMEVK